MKNIEKSLWDLAQKELENSGYEMSPSCEKYLKAFIKEGVKHLNESNVQEMTQVNHNLQIFIGKMIRENYTDENTQILHDKHFLRVKKWICPLYPFC